MTDEYRLCVYGRAVLVTDANDEDLADNFGVPDSVHILRGGAGGVPCDVFLSEASDEIEQLRAEAKDVLKGCSRCDYDEASGRVMDHCSACCRRVTRLVCQSLADEARKQKKKP